MWHTIALLLFVGCGTPHAPGPEAPWPPVVPTPRPDTGSTELVWDAQGSALELGPTDVSDDTGQVAGVGLVWSR